ncbi:hypothetical protein BG004_004542 [Podila humilis]|nr:hypothetical protein BG004_004542 [Podila humilis]
MPSNPSNGSSQAQSNQSSSGSKVSRSRSLTRPERQRPKQGMLNRTPSQKTQDHIAFQGDMNDSTGNLIQSTSNRGMSAAQAAKLQQQEQRTRIQQANMPQQPQPVSQRPRGPRRSSTLKRNASGRGQRQPDGTYLPGPPQRRPSTLAKAKKKFQERDIELTAWVIFSRILTCCIPSGLLRCCNSKKFSREQVIQAWREKVTLCMIIVLVCGTLGFIIFGLEPVLCPYESRESKSYSTLPTNGQPATKSK